MSSRAAEVTLPYSEALDFLPGTSPLQNPGYTIKDTVLEISSGFFVA